MGPSILPGGRIVAPLGRLYPAGAGGFGIAVSPDGRRVVSVNSTGRNSFTILDRNTAGDWAVRQLPAAVRDPDGPDEDEDENRWRGLFMGLAFSGDRTLLASEGNSGRVGIFDTNGEKRRDIDLNQGEFRDSYSGDLAYDSEREILYVVDQANFRVVTIDTKSRRILASTTVGRLPFAVALSPDRRRLYVTNLGMFRYRAIPGADPSRAAETGLPFPPFGFPGAEAVSGVERRTAGGPVQVPGLGDPNTEESNSLAVLDVSNPAAPKLEAFVRTGLPFGPDSAGGSSPSGVTATADQVFVSNAANDSITVLEARTNRIQGEIPLRIPGLENLRGVLPIGLTIHPDSGLLLVAEAGINAVGVVDPKQLRLLGHIPAGWFPTRIAVHGGQAFVLNARGQGRGANAPGALYPAPPLLPRQGTIQEFSVPSTAELPALTGRVLDANGFRSRQGAGPPLPEAIRYVVLIVKENRTYDEVFGDKQAAANGTFMGNPELARLGTRGYVDGKGKRLSIKDVNLTPNHHEIARRWTSGDNFYADSDVSVDGHHWVAGSYPNAWTESSRMAAYSDQRKDFRLGTAPGRLVFAGSAASVHPEEQLEAGTIWHHLERHKIPFLNFGEGFELAGINEGKGLEPSGGRFLTNMPMPDPLFHNTSREYPGFNMNIPDQFRASQFIREIQTKYVETGVELPRFLFLHLPNDHMADPRPEDGYPYAESFVVDNDYALGRIVQFLSGTKWWPRMAVFVTEDDAQGGVDHIDAQRTLFLCAGPWAKKDTVLHQNMSFPGMLKTIFRLLGVPPLNLFDAAATDAGACFAAQPDPAPYQAIPVDKRIFNPEAARTNTSGTPGPRMDDPREVRR
jgi:DNA-binding beta-propeller fold protein YncE